MKSKFKRFSRLTIPLFLCLSLVVIMAAPVSALQFVDYRDFASYDFSSDYATVTVKLPTSQCRWDTYTIHYNQYIGTYVGSYFYWDVTTDNYAMFVNPFGTSFNVNSTVGSSSQDGFALRLDDFPKDAQINCTIKIEFPDSLGLIHEDTSFRNYYVDGDVISSRTDSSVVPVNTGSGFTYSFTMYRGDYSGSADGWLFALSIPDFWVRTNGQVTCSLEDLSVSFSISDLQYQAEQSGKTNQLLEDVKSELANQGKTMEDVLEQQQQTNDKIDDITGYQPEVSTPVGGEGVGDLGDVENELITDITDYLNMGTDMLGSASSLLSSYAASFGGAVLLLQQFIEVPLFGDLVQISLALGIIAVILGISIETVKAYSHAQKERGKYLDTRPKERS